MVRSDNLNLIFLVSGHALRVVNKKCGLPGPSASGVVAPMALVSIRLVSPRKGRIGLGLKDP